ncbi:MAG: hypothetical protein QG635_1758 [Bacteroidota bacterium]|nr:hypothetical protein [Bacteroidota bacterium]
MLIADKIKETKFAFKSNIFIDSDDNKPEVPEETAPPLLGGKVLVLNQSYEPVTVCSPRKAIILLYLMKAELVAKRDGQVIRSVSNAFPLPSVIRLSTFFHIPFKRVELSRKNIIRRDNSRCQYCGTKTGDLTIDHVIPKSRGGADSWENLVTACVRCNNKKGSRTPDEAGMSLIKKPNKPHHIMFFKQFNGRIDSTWKPFLFMD